MDDSYDSCEPVQQQHEQPILTSGRALDIEPWKLTRNILTTGKKDMETSCPLLLPTSPPNDQEDLQISILTQQSPQYLQT